MQALGFHSNYRFWYRVATVLEKKQSRKTFFIDILKPYQSKFTWSKFFHCDSGHFKIWKILNWFKNLETDDDNKMQLQLPLISIFEAFCLFSSSYLNWIFLFVFRHCLSDSSHLIR